MNHIVEIMCADPDCSNWLRLEFDDAPWDDEIRDVLTEQYFWGATPSTNPMRDYDYWCESHSGRGEEEPDE